MVFLFLCNPITIWVRLQWKLRQKLTVLQILPVRHEREFQFQTFPNTLKSILSKVGLRTLFSFQFLIPKFWNRVYLFPIPTLGNPAFHSHLQSQLKKSRIRETKNLLTDADSRTDTILERLRDLSFFFLFFFLLFLRERKITQPLSL